jgi:CysZ protein
MSELARGLGDIARGLGFLNKHPRLWGWVIAPALATLVLLAGIGIAGARLLTPLVDRVTGALPEILQGIGSTVVWLLVIVGLGIAAWLLFVALVGVVAGPFCELLSEAVDERLTGRPGPRFSLGGFLRDAAVGVAHGLRRLVVTVCCIVGLFALSFVPVIGTIAALLIGAWLTARGAAYDCYDAVLARRGLAYRDKLGYLARHRSRTFGLGLGVAGMLLVPGLNLVALGIGATGATLAAHDLTRDELPGSQSL